MEPAVIKGPFKKELRSLLSLVIFSWWERYSTGIRYPREIFLWDSIEGQQSVCVCVDEGNNYCTTAGLKPFWLFHLSCHFSSSAPCPNRHLRGGGVASLLQQEQNRGAVTNCEVLLLSRASGRHHQSRPVVCRWYAPAEYFMDYCHFHKSWG